MLNKIEALEINDSLKHADEGEYPLFTIFQKRNFYCQLTPDLIKDRISGTAYTSFHDYCCRTEKIRHYDANKILNISGLQVSLIYIYIIW